MKHIMMILVHDATELHALKIQNFERVFVKDVFSDFVYCLDGWTICFFIGPAVCSCMTCTAMILGPAFSLIGTWLITNCFLVRVQKEVFLRTFYVPPLLKTLSARSFTLVEKIALLSKSEWSGQLWGLRYCTSLYFDPVSKGNMISRFEDNKVLCKRKSLYFWYFLGNLLKVAWNWSRTESTFRC